MRKMLYKELKLAASPLSFFFIAGALLTFAPGYPILLGAFFITLGIFYSFQTMRENNDIVFSLLLPISKADMVKSKYCFTLFIELCGFILMAAVTFVRMALLNGLEPYVSNALMCANLSFLGFAVLIFGLFNIIFVSGFFKTAYYIGKPFIIYCIAAMAAIVIAESLHYFPGLETVNAPDFGNMTAQVICLVAGAASGTILTAAGIKRSVRLFEKTDI